MDRAVPVGGQFEIRSLPNGGTRFTGYASVFNSDSEPLPFTERVLPGAFTQSLEGSRAQTFVLNHDDSLLFASRRTDRLRLSQDATGLLTDADLPDTSYASDLRALNATGEVWGMSFTFRAVRGGESWSADRMRRDLSNVALGHVTVLTGLQPAYPATSGTTSIRSLAKAMKVNPRDLDEVLELIEQGRPLSARQYQILLDLTVQLNPAPGEPDGDEADQDDALAPIPPKDPLVPGAQPSQTPVLEGEGNAVHVGGMEDAENPVEENSVHVGGADERPPAARTLAEYKALLRAKGLL